MLVKNGFYQDNLDLDHNTDADDNIVIDPHAE